MKPWWQVAVPHEDIREGRLEESVFAASLGDMVQHRGAVDYRDPATFFRKTFFTTGLTNLISAVLLKLSSASRGDTVIQIQTPFGGGKTHALLALYHVFKHPEEAMRHEAIKKILKKNKMTRIPETKVVVFVGEYADPLKGRTLWGEIAHQLGCYELVKEYDEKKVAPGKDLIFKMLSENKPALILMDELLQYVVRALGVEVKEGTLKGQVQSFLKALTEVVTASERCALIATLPSSVTEGFEEPEKAERILSELQKIFGRVEKIYTPVEGEEIYEIIRKRLFEDLGDPEEHRRVVEEYFELYRSLGEDIPSECREASYKERMLKAYPFHPETIDVLHERWATIPTFQRTRGALRLLAEVTADLFKRGHIAPLIQPAHINLGNPSIRREFIKHIGNEYEGVIASDISGPNAKAEKIDREIGKEYAGFNVATGIATSIFFYSFSGGERKGVTIQRLRLAFLRKDIPPTIVSEVVRKLEDELWYLHFEKNFYYFSNIVGLNRVIIDKEEAIKDEDIQQEVESRIERIERLSDKDFEVFVWPKSDSDVPDSKRLKLIILPYTLMVNDPTTIEFMKNMINKYSTGFRTYRNTLIFTIADPNEFEGCRRSIRRFLALDAIKKDKGTMMRLTEEDRERVSQKLEDADSSASRMLLSLYRHMGKASKDGIKIFDLGIPAVEKGLTISKRVKDHLMDQDVFLKKISPKVLVEKTFSKEDDRKKISEVWEAFLKFSELPMLESIHVLFDAVVQGVREGIFGLLIGEKVKYAEAISPAEVSEEAFIVRKEVTQKMREEAVIPVREETHLLAVPERVSGVQKGVIRRITLRANVPWDRLSDMVRGVFTPLIHEGAKITLEVKIEAESHQGIKKDTLDLKIRETLKQIGAEVLEEREE